MTTKTEYEVLQELSSLCGSPGYIHALASICRTNNFAEFGSAVDGAAMLQTYRSEKLIRSEMALLVGLMLCCERDVSSVTNETVTIYQRATTTLLEELHDVFRSFFTPITEYLPNSHSRMGISMEEMREIIFYSGESAYMSQYERLAVKRYANDDAWLEANKGFTIEEAAKVVQAIRNTANFKMAFISRTRTNDSKLNWLSGFSFCAADLVGLTRLDVVKIESVIKAFCVELDETNKPFTQVFDANVINERPLIKLPNGNYVCFLIQSLFEALYQSPIYWMRKGAGYKDAADKHRGDSAELFIYDRLSSIFGADNVHPNVKVMASKSKTISDIDCLVVFGDRALVVQAKTKGLTIAARQGSEVQLDSDFQKSVQDSYEQARVCANALVERKHKFYSRSTEIEFQTPFKEIFILNVLSEHYPSLNFQVRDSLQFTTSDSTLPPFVLDIFTFDLIAEMLSSPLYFLSYIQRRVTYHFRVFAGHESSVLAYHLRKNLWLTEERDSLHLSDDVSADLDASMSVRFDGLTGSSTPTGILTRFQNTPFNRIISQIDSEKHPTIIELGFELLRTSEDFVENLNAYILKAMNLHQVDGRGHDVTISFGSGGLTLYLNSDPYDEVTERLHLHCRRRKYKHRANVWFGVCVEPTDLALRFASKLEFEWEFDKNLEEATRDMQGLTK